MPEQILQHQPQPLIFLIFNLFQGPFSHWGNFKDGHAFVAGAGFLDNKSVYITIYILPIVLPYQKMQEFFREHQHGAIESALGQAVMQNLRNPFISLGKILTPESTLNIANQQIEFWSALD
jgi:hypothetical protein